MRGYFAQPPLIVFFILSYTSVFFNPSNSEIFLKKVQNLSGILMFSCLPPESLLYFYKFKTEFNNKEPLPCHFNYRKN